MSVAVIGVRTIVAARPRVMVHNHETSNHYGSFYGKGRSLKSLRSKRLSISKDSRSMVLTLDDLIGGKQAKEKSGNPTLFGFFQNPEIENVQTVIELVDCVALTLERQIQHYQKTHPLTTGQEARFSREFDGNSFLENVRFVEGHCGAYGKQMLTGEGYDIDRVELLGCRRFLFEVISLAEFGRSQWRRLKEIESQLPEAKATKARELRDEKITILARHFIAVQILKEKIEELREMQM